MPSAPDPPRVDLHGLRPDQAVRRVRQELHAARVRGAPALLVITGRGQGNARQEPILRRRIAAWLEGAEASALGVRGYTVTSKGGALEVRLGSPGGRAPEDPEDEGRRG